MQEFSNNKDKTQSGLTTGPAVFFSFLLNLHVHFFSNNDNMIGENL
jgi:hypothetical protein